MFIRGRKVTITLVFITQSYFKVPKDVRLNTTHFIISKIPNKRELQQIAINHSTARKTIFSFSGRPEKMVFAKKLRRNMIFLVLPGKMIFLFPENMISHVRRKMKDDLSKKIHGNMIFSSNLLKRWSFQKRPRRHMIFLVLSGKMVFFS